jgi:small subunit ribosomal protein S20
MANIKSAEKRIRTTARKTKANKSVKSKLRRAIKTQRGDGGTKSLSTTVSQIDRALAKGVIHKNAAARYKSRLSKAAAKAK